MNSVSDSGAGVISPRIKQLALQGARKKRLDKGRIRLVVVMTVFFAVFTSITGRLVYMAVTGKPRAIVARSADDLPAMSRPDVVDRNGVILATDVRKPSLFAQPNRIIDANEAADLLADALPDISTSELRSKLASGKGFIWLKRGINEAEQQRVHRLGIPGIGFREENRRVYPSGRTLSHVIGHVGIENIGAAGLEKWIDADRGLIALREAGLSGERDRDNSAVELSIDLRAQHALRDELAEAMKLYAAVGASGVILDVTTGEIVALASLPDYDPNDPKDSIDLNALNRITTGTYELGSIFKAFTVAMALESGRFTMASQLDARAPLQFGSQRIGDFHGKGRVLTMPEVFIYSSNIGSAKMALALGVDHHREFMQKLGFADRLRTELPESAKPQFRRRQWKPVESATIAFGHGIAVAPLQAAAATAALMNGGYLVRPTFRKRSAEEARALAPRVLSQATSDAMRQLFRLNVEKGSGKRAEVEGFLVGGKTGTADKPGPHGYQKNKRLNSFLAAFPTDKPRYVVLVTLDEPQRTPGAGEATAGLNAAPTVGKVISRVAPLLQVAPRIERLAGSQPALALPAVR